jgi:nucleosome binding factor SPN SPT16 subunit
MLNWNALRELQLKIFDSCTLLILSACFTIGLYKTVYLASNMDKKKKTDEEAADDEESRLESEHDFEEAQDDPEDEEDTDDIDDKNVYGD